jgi:hypothetical protein
MRTIVSAVFFAVLSFMMMPTSSAAPSHDADADADEKRGCCSHHGGVCGCSSNHTTCCDGSMSPTCQCRGE